MASDEEIREKLIAFTAGPIQVEPAVVVEVNEETLVALVNPLEGAELNARLKAAEDSTSNYFLSVPKVGSTVLIGIIGNDEDEAFVIICNEIDKVICKIENMFFVMTKDNFKFNGGDNGGLINISSIVDKLNVLEERMTSHQHLCASPGNPTTPDPATNTNIENTTISDLQDSKILH